MIDLVRLTEVATFMGGGTPSRANRHYFDGGIPWVKTTDLNNGPILSTEETLTARGIAESSCKMVPAEAVLVAMYGGFNQIGRTGILTMGSAINQALTAIIANPSKLDPSFLLEWLNFRVGYWKRFAGSSRKDPNITKGDVAAFPVPRIEIERQRAISKILGHWNRAIDITEKLLAEKMQFRKGLMQQLLTGKRRLPGNKREWKTSELGVYIREVSQRNRTVGIKQVLSVTNEKGFVLPEEYFSRPIASTDLGNYKVVRRNQFAYNPSRINVGSLALLTNFDEGVISPMYVVFETINGLESHYLNYWLSSHEGRQWIRSLAQGTVRNAVSFDALASIELELPTFEEQCTIVKVLRTADHEIEILQAKAEALREQKTGLMQQLLTGKKRVTACAS